MTIGRPARNVPAASRKQTLIAGLAILAGACHLLLRFAFRAEGTVLGLRLVDLPLLLALALGGVPLVLELLLKLLRREFGSDLLAGISIVTAVLLGEYLAGTLVVLMLSGGEALEAYAVRSASSVLEALARRMPSLAHRRRDGQVVDVALGEVATGETLVVFPHEICPVDGTVLEGHGVMDESYLTGEPYVMSKIPGSSVLSGAINGERALTIRAEKLAVDSRYAKIMEVMRASEQHRPRLRRIGDQLGAFYTPLAVAIALTAWAVSGEVVRCLAVLVVATPCPLLIAIPVAIIGAISLSARRGIIIKDPAVLERIDTCRTAIFDKTGTLTYGQPMLTQVVPGPGFTEGEVLALVASLERYSKHPLGVAVLEAARGKGLSLLDAGEVREPPGQGLRGIVGTRSVQVASRKQLVTQQPQLEKLIPPFEAGMECVIAIDGRYAATFRFRDQPRAEGAAFVHHLRPNHYFDRILIVSGDRESEVRYLAEKVGIQEVHASQSPEQKVAIVRQETQRANTVFLGDGINDAPALTAATVGIAFGQNSDITAEAAGAVILDTSLAKVDEFMHISRRLRSILLQSAIGGIALSLIGMGIAAAGYLPPVAGAIMQEVIDVLVVVNALRVAFPPKKLTDYDSSSRDGMGVSRTGTARALRRSEAGGKGGGDASPSTGGKIMSLRRDRTAWFQGGDARCADPPPARDRPYRLVLLGPPGVGKGTQAELLCQALGTCHLSTGDFFRAAQCQAEPSPALAAALETMRRGELVPDALVVSMVRERAGCLRCQGGFLLDGFPRTEAQAEALDVLLTERGVALDAVLSYELPLEEVVARLSGRRTCATCNAVYHVTARPARVADACDVCGGPLLQRADDRPESIRVRMQAYEESTRPLAEYYERSRKLLTIPASGMPEEILERSLHALDDRLAKGRG